MDNLHLNHMPVAKTGMLIRQPVAKVFGAFVDPSITTRFWFTKSSGRLEVGKRITWEWEMYDASTHVTAKIVEPNKRVVIEWDVGFTWTLAGLKTLLEHNVRLNLVADRFPRGPGEPYPDE